MTINKRNAVRRKLALKLAMKTGQQAYYNQRIECDSDNCTSVNCAFRANLQAATEEYNWLMNGKLNGYLRYGVPQLQAML